MRCISSSGSSSMRDSIFVICTSARRCCTRSESMVKPSTSVPRTWPAVTVTGPILPRRRATNCRPDSVVAM